MDIDIKRGIYNKTDVTGNYHEVNLDKKYVYYDVTVSKRYYDISSEDDLIRAVIKDFNDLKHRLENINNKRVMSRSGSGSGKGSRKDSRSEEQEL